MSWPLIRIHLLLAQKGIKYAACFINLELTRIFSVSELNERIRDRLETDLRLHDLWARGEISNVTNHRSGHRYFTLKDRDSQLSCVLFRNHGQRLGFELQDGQNVLVFGDVGVYAPQGRVQLMARGIRLDAGLGERYREVEALKAKLSAEGLFSQERKRQLPRFPESIGIVTSPDGAALRDVMRILGSYPARIFLSPAQVQGEGAEESIVLAISALKSRVDVLIVCRGGGSAEDLWPFNSEQVARAIFECDTPVISAIGHETDVTIADFVADVRAATPTAAARMAIPDLEKTRSELHLLEARMAKALWSCLEREEARLDYLQRSLSARRMYSRLTEKRQMLDYWGERLAAAEKKLLQDRNIRLSMLEGRLDSVSPLATLSRGYAIARSSRGPILRPEDACVGEVLDLILAQGRLRCRVLDREEI
jgi:exodeoxyribonuclease VII large subunit